MISWVLKPMQFFLLLYFCLVFLACSKDVSLYNISNLNNNKVLVFGHGGMGYRNKLPMNTAASVEECIQSGADGVEVDLQMSSDGKLFFYHDNLLEDATDCAGAIAALSAEEISSCHYHKGRKKHNVLNANDFFSQGKLQNRLIAFDCKPQAGQPAEKFAHALALLINRYTLEDVALVESHDINLLQLLKVKLPGAQTYLYCNNAAEAFAVQDSIGLSGFTIHMEKVNADQVAEAHKKNLKVSLFGAGTEAANLRALQLSPDHIQTDCLLHLLQVYSFRVE